MSIAWKYLDKKSAAVEALKDYSIMEFIIRSYPADMEEAREDMVSYRASVLSALPKAHDPKAGETRLAATIDEIDVIRERYRQALEFMEWYHPAWDALHEDERFVLGEFYRNDEDSQKDAVDGICRRFTIERSSAYNRKNRALAKLALLLYGK
jgi:hypothetical protein